jgi:phenylacetate-CoA ligase
VLFRQRAYREFGVKLWDRIATVGKLRLHDPNDTKLIGRSLQVIGVQPRLALDGMQDPERTIEQLAWFQPQMVAGLPGMLSRVADCLLASERRDIRPQVLITGGEVLTSLAKRRLSEAFGVAPVQTYMSHEFPLMGWECRETGAIHTCDDGFIIEVLRDGKPARPGETGEIVVTNLHAYAMPLIRYRLGDLVTRGGDRCACGKPFATISRIQGRMIDYMTLANARVVHPYVLVEAFLPGLDVSVRQYQLVQERPDRIVLTVVPGASWPADLRDRITRSVRPLLGDEIEFELRLTDDIPLDPSGKFRHSRSLVRSAYDAADEGRRRD